MKQRRLKLELLESRALLATVGGPWPNPRDLTLSFAPDGTRIGLFASELFATLGRQRAASAWQTDVVRAFQTWAAVANIDIGLVPDTGRAFGAAGLAQGDPRFGDIRLGAFPQARAIASAVPYRAVAGSWSGDVFLNSSLAAGLQSAAIDLYSVLLNEAGNALGLADTNDPDTVMYTDYRGERSGLAAADIAAIQALYGERTPDANDASGGNDSNLTATTVNVGTGVALVAADLHRADDVDYYRIPALGEGGRLSVRLVAAGESFLVGAVDVLRSDGTKVASAAAGGPLANNVELAVPLLPPRGDMLIRVAAKSSDVFAVGGYRLEVSVRSGDGVTAPVPGGAPDPAPADVVLPAIGQARSYPAVVGYLDEEVGQNDSFATATTLETPFGYVPDTRYEAVGAIRAAEDIDVYRIMASETGDRRLTVYLDTFDVRLVDFRIALHDADGNLVVEQAVPQADGRLVLDVADVILGEAYYLSVSAGGPGGSSLGNYVLVTDFIREDPYMMPLGSGTLATPAQRDVQLWHTERTLLYRFDLRPDGGATDAAVRLEMHDADGQAIAAVRAPAGATSTHYVWLPAGSFEFVIEPDAAALEGFLPIDYVLSAAALSDDVGPGLVDPTENPLPGDADGSGVVDRGDAAVVAGDFGQFADTLPSLADFDGDGDVDLADLLTVATNLGRALLPDLTTSNTTGGGSTTGTQAPSAIVVALPKTDSSGPEANSGLAKAAPGRRRSSHDESPGLAASRARRPSPQHVDTVLGVDMGTAVPPAAPDKSSASGRRRSR